MSGRVPVPVSDHMADFVEHEHCDACGFDGSRFDAAQLLIAVRDLGLRWQNLLTRAEGNLRLRPEPGVWSAIEYAAHSRDITALHAFGVEKALSGHEPSYPSIDGESLIAAAAATYRDADGLEVARELACQASLLAECAENAGVGAWSRGLTVGETRSDVRRLLEHALHDSTHHLADVERGLSAIQTRRDDAEPLDG